MDRAVTPEYLAQVLGKVQNASNDDTPFPMIKDEKIAVIGDANKTEVKKNNYEIKFMLPKDMVKEVPEGAKEVGDSYLITVIYESVHMTPRKNAKVVGEILGMEPFINKLKEDGRVESLTGSEIVGMIMRESDGVLLSMYRVVGAFLGIDDVMGEYMLPGAVIRAFDKLTDTHPEVFNEADVFFG